MEPKSIQKRRRNSRAKKLPHGSGLERSWVDLGPLICPKSCSHPHGGHFFKIHMLCLLRPPTAIRDRKRAKNGAEMPPKREPKRSQIHVKNQSFFGSIFGSIWVAVVLPRGANRHPRGTQEAPRDPQEKVCGLGVAPLAFGEFTRWCPQRVVLLQRRSKVAFPTSWGL